MKLIIYLVLFVAFISCNNLKEQKQQLIPNKNISKILEDFVTENKCPNCCYEIYINKEYPHLSTIIIYMGSKSLTKDENDHGGMKALNIVTTSSGVEFKIYSGVEQYFKSNNDVVLKDIDRAIKNNSEIEKKIWVVIDSFGVLKTTKRNFAYPFIPLPQFPEPKIKPIMNTK